MSNFLSIGQTFAEMWQFFDFEGQFMSSYKFCANRTISCRDMAIFIWVEECPSVRPSVQKKFL